MKDKINKETMEKASDISRAHKVAEEVDKKKILEGNKTSEAILKRVWAIGDEEDKTESKSGFSGSSSSSSTSQFKKTMSEYYSEKKEEKKEEKSSGYSYGSWRSSSSSEKKKTEDPKRKLLAQKISIDIKTAKASVLTDTLRSEEYFNVVGERDMWIRKNMRMRIEDYPEAQKRILRENNHMVDAIREIGKIQSRAIVNVYKIANQKTLKERKDEIKK